MKPRKDRKVQDDANLPRELAEQAESLVKEISVENGEFYEENSEKIDNIELNLHYGINAYYSLQEAIDNRDKEGISDGEKEGYSQDAMYLQEDAENHLGGALGGVDNVLTILKSNSYESEKN